MLFANEELIKIYFDENGKITEKETEDWVSIPKEASADIRIAYEKAVNRTVKVHQNNSYEVKMFEQEQKLFGFLVKVVKAWSEDAPINEINMHKLDSRVYNSLLTHVVERYHLVEPREQEKNEEE